MEYYLYFDVDSGKFFVSWGTIKLMLFLEFFTWWYSRGWTEIAKDSIGLINKVQLSFSIPILLRTLFSPWKQIITYPGRSIDEKFRAVMDNLVSRAVGFVVRLISLFTAVILIILAAVIGVIMSVVWPLVPVLVVYCVFRGIVG